MATLDTTTRVGDYDARSSVDAQALRWDWKTWPVSLRRSAILLLGCVLLLAVVIYLKLWVERDLQQKLALHKQLHAQALSRLGNSGRERAAIVRLLPLYEKLQNDGVVGNEQRLEWVEQLRAIEQRWPRLEIQFTIEPQARVAPVQGPTQGSGQAGGTGLGEDALLPNGEKASQFSLFDTQMHLSMRVMHEGDVLAVLAGLEQARLGYFRPQRCVIGRAGLGGKQFGSAAAGSQDRPSPAAGATGRAIPTHPTSPQYSDSSSASGLLAECTLRWTTMQTHAAPLQ